MLRLFVVVMNGTYFERAVIFNSITLKTITKYFVFFVIVLRVIFGFLTPADVAGLNIKTALQTIDDDETGSKS